MKITWTCNSRVDYVDEEMLRLMGRAGCTLISWGIESGNELILKKAHKGYKMEQAHKALHWAHKAGIKNWGYFIIGLPGETVETINETMAISKKLPLDIALFHVAAPYPGTPFFFEVVENDWFREGTNWEEVDMDQGTVLDYEQPQSRRPALLAEARFPRMGLPARPGDDHDQVDEYVGRLQECDRILACKRWDGSKASSPRPDHPAGINPSPEAACVIAHRGRLAGPVFVCGPATRQTFAAWRPLAPNHRPGRACIRWRLGVITLNASQPDQLISPYGGQLVDLLVPAAESDAL